jgi:SAM-dependent methyltransferase
MTSRAQDHWEGVYASKAADRVSWYRPHLDESLRYVSAARLDPTDAIIDVGGGASTLVDDLLDRGHVNLTVLDLSAAALETAKQRLGDRAAAVRWICGDVTQVELPPTTYRLWHDRAVFHFLTDPAARARYAEAARKALVPGGHLVIATFGPHGPERCSGLEVLRLDADAIAAELGGAFVKVADSTELHRTPWATEQEFVYCHLTLRR